MELRPHPTNGNRTLVMPITPEEVRVMESVALFPSGEYSHRNRSLQKQAGRLASDAIRLFQDLSAFPEREFFAHPQNPLLLLTREQMREKAEAWSGMSQQLCEHFALQTD